MARAAVTAKGRSLMPDGKSARGRNRREMILAEAAKLFRRHGFQETGIDDIGNAVGITGPGVYRHFESKHRLLAAIVERSMEQHQAIVSDVKASDLPPRQALDRLVRLSAEALANDRDAAAVYFQESRNLPEAELERFTRVQRLMIAEWVAALRKVRPELDEDDARVAVRGVAGLLNSVGYFSAPMPRERLAQLLADMAIAALLPSPDTA